MTLQSALLLFSILAAPASAQLLTVAPGTRVRVTAPSVSMRSIVGTLVESARDSLLVAVPDRRAGQDIPSSTLRIWVQRSQLDRVEISYGRSGWTGAKRGALFGVAGASIIWMAAAIGAIDSGPEGLQFGPIEGTMLISAFIVPPAALAGALIGGEKWTRVYVRPR
jgi:hypothetical protein